MQQKRSSEGPASFRTGPKNPLVAVHEHFRNYATVLHKLIKAEDVNMLPKVPQRLWDDLLRVELADSVVSWQETVLQSDIPTLLITAASHVTNMVAMKAGPTSLLTNSTACNVVITLWLDIKKLLHELGRSPPSEEYSSSVMKIRQLAASEMLPALAKYSQNIVMAALKELEATTKQLLQKQSTIQAQQHCTWQALLADSGLQAMMTIHCEVTPHVCGILFLWHELLVSSALVPASQLGAVFTAMLPAAVDLATTAVPLLSKGLSLVDSSTGSAQRNAKLPILQEEKSSSAEQCLGLQTTLWAAVQLSNALTVVLMKVLHIELGALPDDPAQGEHAQLYVPGHNEQHILLTRKLPELLLLVLAHQAASLHARTTLASYQPATAYGEAQWSSSTASSTWTLQQIADKWQPDLQQGLFNSHKVLLTALGIPAAVQAAEKVDFSEVYWSMGSFLLRTVIELYIQVTPCTSSNDEQQHNEFIPTFPTHLISTAVKMLLELAVLLLASDNLSMHPDCLEPLLSLLSLSEQNEATVKQPAAAAQAHSSHSGAKQRLVGSFAGYQAMTAKKSVLWPVLPPATAAALLQPIVQLLSRAVIKALRSDKDTACISTIAAYDLGTQQGSFLCCYGHLLVSVCQSVDPKHIAAVLRSEPVIPLVAIEAVMRHQRIHLRPLEQQQGQQQQQQQQSGPSRQAEATKHRTASASPSTDHSQILTEHQAAEQYLQFVTKVMQAVHLLVQDRQFCAQFVTNGGPEQHSQPDTFSTMVVRVFSLAMSAHKVQLLAALYWHKNQARLVSRAVSGPKASTSVSDAMKPPNWYMASTTAITGIADALSRAMHDASEISSSSRGSGMHHPGGSTGSKQHHSLGDSSGDHMKTDDNSARSPGALQGGFVSSLPYVLMLRVLHAAVYLLKSEHETVTQLIAAVKENTTCPADGVLTAALETSLSALLFSTPTSLVAVLRMVGVTSDVLQRMLAWKNRRIGNYAMTSQHDDAARARASASGDCIKDPGQNTQQQLPRQGIHHAQQQCKDLQGLQCHGPTILADCDLASSQNSVSDQQIPDAIYTATRGSSQDKSLKAVVAAVCVGLSGGVSRAGSGGPQVSAQEHQHSGAADAINSINSINAIAEIKFYCQLLQNCILSFLSEAPVPFCCNRSTCLCLSRLSEYQLVSGKASVCGGCKVARYCSKKCQKDSWSHHKQECKKIQQIRSSL